MFSSAYEIASLIIGLLGAFTTILAFFPQCIKTIKTKDTSGLSLWFFIIAIISSIFWLCLGILTICSPFYFLKDEISIANSLSAGIPPIVTNVITLILNLTVIYIKFNNIKQAKKLNLTEQEYCKHQSDLRTKNATLKFKNKQDKTK